MTPTPDPTPANGERLLREVLRETWRAGWSYGHHGYELDSAGARRGLDREVDAAVSQLDALLAARGIAAPAAARAAEGAGK